MNSDAYQTACSVFSSWGGSEEGCKSSSLWVYLCIMTIFSEQFLQMEMMRFLLILTTQSHTSRWWMKAGGGGSAGAK